MALAMASAAVLGLMNYANRRQAPNCRRVACRTSWRLLANDITTFSRRVQRLEVGYTAGADEVWFKT